MKNTLPDRNLPVSGILVTDVVVMTVRTLACGTGLNSLSSSCTLWALALRLTTFVVTNSDVPNRVRPRTRKTVVTTVSLSLTLISVATRLRRSTAEQVSSFPRLPCYSVTIVLTISAATLVFVMT